MGGELAEPGFEQRQSGFRTWALIPRLGCFSVSKISVSWTAMCPDLYAIYLDIFCTIVFTVVVFKNETKY